MATFPRGHSSNTRLDGRRRWRPSSKQSVNTTPAKVTWFVDPSDSLTLRGIPAVGRYAQGAIRGTTPGSAFGHEDS